MSNNFNKGEYDLGMIGFVIFVFAMAGLTIYGVAWLVG